jgi:pimeloyl-ACP methyl ester carboxylesterase
VTSLEPIGEGPPLVYLPGLDGSGELLFAQEDELGTRYRIHRVRYRSEGEFTYDDLVRDVIEVLDEADVKRATIVAESFGGTIGLHLALAYPERVERLMVLNTFAKFSNRRFLRWGGLLIRRAPPRLVHAVRYAIDTPTLALLERIPRDRRRRFLDVARRQPLCGYARRIELLEKLDFTGDLSEISVPTLVVSGEVDRVVPSAASRELAKRIPGAILRTLPGVGHAALMTPGVSLLEILQNWPQINTDEHS